MQNQKLIRVLLNGAALSAFAHFGHPPAFACSHFGLTIHLRHGNNGNFQFHRQPFKRSGNLADFFRAVVGLSAAPEQLQVIHDNHIKPRLLPLSEGKGTDLQRGLCLRADAQLDLPHFRIRGNDALNLLIGKVARFNGIHRHA